MNLNHLFSRTKQVAIVFAVGVSTWVTATHAQTISVSTISVAQGAVGEFVVSLTLASGNQHVVSAQVDVGFTSSATPVVVKSNGAPDCTVNSALAKEGSTVFFLPRGCSGSACNSVRGLVYSTENLQDIPSGAWLFKCKVQGNSVGTYSLAGSNQVASDPLGQRHSNPGVTNGSVTVTSAPPPPPPGC